ncbi:MAG: hypothetical protein IPJ75_15060 [Ignavibacteriales bacterium]|nr:hypothetical protein [Ignavibacteriales bacterium]
MSLKVLVLTIFIFSVSSFAQNFSINDYMPLNLREAVEKGFRTYNGKPGKNYVQNDVSYKIDAELLPKEGKVRGKVVIKYKNNFPNALEKLVIRLYQDAFKRVWGEISRLILLMFTMEQIFRILKLMVKILI